MIGTGSIFKALGSERDDRTSKQGHYAGGSIRFSQSAALQWMAGLDLPISDRDKGVRGAADYRARMNLTWSF